VHKLNEKEVQKKIREFDSSHSSVDPSQLKKMVAEVKMEITESVEILDT
jgi:hypothetical protein